MAPANISFRQRSRRRFIFPVIVVVVAIAAALVYVGSRKTTTSKKAEEKTPQVAFTVAGFQVLSEGKAVAPATAEPERAAVVQLLTEYYQAAFVDPKEWVDPNFTALQANFSTEARATFAQNIASLTIGPGRTEFKRVEPAIAQVKLSLYYDTAGRPQLAVATVHFAARATTDAKRPVDVVQDATYRLQRQRSGWQIFSYQAKATQDTPSPSPTATPTS